jgi:hypothetical protein
VRATRLLALCFSDTALTTRGGSLLIAPRAVKPKQPKIPRLIKFRQRPRIMFEPGFRFGSRAAVEAGLIVRPVSPQLRKCRLRSHSYAWCQKGTWCRRGPKWFYSMSRVSFMGYDNRGIRYFGMVSLHGESAKHV